MDTSRFWKFFRPASSGGLDAVTAKAAQGDADAQFALGIKYGAGEGPNQDFPQAMLFYRQAADQNHSLAQFNLGLMYAEGQGVLKDDAQAVIWFRKAADHGDAGAQHNLGMRYHRASVRSVQLDTLDPKIEAYKWFHLAAAQGYQGSAEACDMMTLDMTREEVTEGNQRAGAFLAH